MYLECRDITYRYPLSETPVFQGLSFAIDVPGFHALFGPSGVGKTSLAKIITRQISGFSGEVKAENGSNLLYTYNLERLPDWSQVGKHLEKITPPHQTGRLDALLSLFGLDEFLTSRFSQLSLGQKNRVNLIRYLVQDFQVLVLDESLANVDERTREAIILAIKEFYPDKCFLYISHNIYEVVRFCHRILVLRANDKRPQLITLSGQDQTRNRPPDRENLSRTMLEVMNAA